MKDVRESESEREREREREKRNRRIREAEEGQECTRRLRKLSRRCVFTQRFTSGQRAFDLHACAPVATAKRVLEVKYATGCARTPWMYSPGIIALAMFIVHMHLYYTSACMSMISHSSLPI